MFDHRIAAERLETMQPQLFIKRSLDLLLSLSLLLLFSPLLLVTAVAIRITSPGPILFVQWRCGYRGSKFPCYKFRSMAAERAGDHSAIQTEELNKAGVLAKSSNDRRVTRVGRLIRKTSIDELPQLLNVFKGEMSIVGPRPLMPHMLEPFPEFREVRGLVRPGITGLWQIRDRKNNTSATFMIPHDTEYIHRLSLLLDLQIVCATIPAVLRQEGAI